MWSYYQGRPTNPYASVSNQIVVSRVDQLWLARGHASEHRVPCGHGDLLGGEVGQAVPAVTAAQVKDPWPIGMLDPHDFVVGAELAPEGERGPVELQVAFRLA